MGFVGDWKVKAMAVEQRKLIFQMLLHIPRHEMYGLTDQIKRSSRSVSANIAEAFSKRSYPLHLRSKLTDAEAENAETKVWLDIAVECNYLKEMDIANILDLNNQISRLLNYMIINKDKFAEKPKP